MSSGGITGIYSSYNSSQMIECKTRTVSLVSSQRAKERLCYSKKKKKKTDCSQQKREKMAIHDHLKAKQMNNRLF